jgi:predicted outer membrane repeat protein
MPYCTLSHGPVAPLLGLFLLGAAAASAATIRIPSEYPNFQAAIDAAASGDTVLAAAALYGGEGNRDIVFRGVPLTILSESGPEETTIDCGGSPHRAFILNAGKASRVTIQGLTITNGDAPKGGAVYVNTSRITLRDCIFHGNRADHSGGAVYVSHNGYDLLVESCVFTANEAQDDGGALYVPCVDTEVSGCRFVDNFAHNGGAIATIAYRCPSSFTISHSLFLGNRTATYGAGGGSYSLGDNPSYLYCTFIGNEASAGGGIYAENGCFVAHSIFRDNRADSGGGVSGWTEDNGGFSTGLCCCVFVRNEGDWGSAAVEGTVTSIVHCTITENCNHGSVLGRGAVTIYPEYSAHVSDSIIWGNDSATDIAVSGGGAEYRYNDIGHTVSGTGNINADPKLTNHFGFPALLRPDSPCVDAGDPGESDAIYDQTPGWPDWYPNGVRADMGAYGGSQNAEWLK